MASAVINGRRVILPDSASDGDIRRVGNIDEKRNLMKRTKEGNFLIARGSKVPVNEGDVFIDAPARVKGERS